MADSSHELVVTSRREVSALGEKAVAIEDLSNDPLIMEGQLLSMLLDESNRSLLVGIDPGSKIGVVVFYGGRELGALTASSVEEVVNLLVMVVHDVSHSSLAVKIGGGERRSALLLANLLRERLEQSASIEIVDESGTSVGRRGSVGATRDERAAVRIAFRKGTQFSGVGLSRKTPG